jgi:hypothetical protein
MNEEMMTRVTRELVALSKEYGIDRDYDDNRLKIPANPAEGLAFVREHSWIKGESFVFDDISIIQELRSLLAVHRVVWVIMNRGSLRLDIYIRPDRQNSTVSSERSGASGSSTKSSGCFIATACYGSYDAPEVMDLRQFRDNVLLMSVTGRLFVRLYYTVSPPIARLIARSNARKTWVRLLLVGPIIKSVKRFSERGVVK